jgi:hypothetical protein
MGNVLQVMKQAQENNQFYFLRSPLLLSVWHKGMKYENLIHLFYKVRTTVLISLIAL